jgi:hypothetical protein
MHADRHHHGTNPQRALNRCVTHTLGDLRRSASRNRTISLPALLRLFRRRWAQIQTGQEHRLLEQAGLDTVRDYYRRHQPFARGSRDA